jgi:glycosyltransferase involved in cell wall biosynthesis
MRIAYLNTVGIPARYGGYEACVEEVSIRLVQKGHEVTVYCGSDSAWKYSSYMGVKLINLRRISNKFLDFPLRCLVSTIDAIPRNFDILHFYGNESSIFTLVPRVLLKKVVISLDGLVWNRASYPSLIRMALRASSRLPLYLPNMTIVDSFYVREWHRRAFGRAPIYIPYGAKVSPRAADPVVLERYGVEENGYLLFVGRLVLEKGVHHLIRAFNRTESEFPLIIVGGDPYSSEYETSLRKMAGRSVRLLGPVYGSDVENLYKGAYMYVSASELEGTSPALLSAMGFGNCVLISDIPENLETVGDAGVTFKSGDCEDLREKMLYLVSNPDVVRDYRKRAVERVAKLYSWDSVAERMEKVYLWLNEKSSERETLGVVS